MVESSTHDYVQVLGQDLFDQCTTNFDLFHQNYAENEVISDRDVIEALLLSLGVDLDPLPSSLSKEGLLQLMKQQVDEASPLDGICTELADKYDPEFTGESSVKDLICFLDE